MRPEHGSRTRSRAVTRTKHGIKPVEPVYIILYSYPVRRAYRLITSDIIFFFNGGERRKRQPGHTAVIIIFIPPRADRIIRVRVPLVHTRRSRNNYTCTMLSTVILYRTIVINGRGRVFVVSVVVAADVLVPDGSEETDRRTTGERRRSLPECRRVYSNSKRRSEKCRDQTYR